MCAQALDEMVARLHLEKIGASSNPNLSQQTKADYYRRAGGGPFLQAEHYRYFVGLAELSRNLPELIVQRWKKKANPWAALCAKFLAMCLENLSRPFPRETDSCPLGGFYVRTKAKAGPGAGGVGRPARQPCSGPCPCYGIGPAVNEEAHRALGFDRHGRWIGVRSRNWRPQAALGSKPPRQPPWCSAGPAGTGIAP